MEPIALILLFVKPKDAPMITTALRLLLQRQSDVIVHSYSVPSLRLHFSMHVNVNESTQLDHTQVLPCQAGPIYLNNYVFLLVFSVCVSV